MPIQTSPSSPTGPSVPEEATRVPGAGSPVGTRGNPRPRQGLALAGWLLVCYVVAAAGSLATVGQIPTWYHGLAKPEVNPPDWVFAPVWTVLYTLMGVSAWLAWRTRDSGCRVRAMRIFLVQLLLNLTWSWLFFQRHRPDLAMVEIALLALGIALTMQAFAKISRPAIVLMAPYLAWVLFAGYLNEEIWRLNR